MARSQRGRFRKVWETEIRTFRHLRSVPKHPPCKRHPGARVLDNVLMLFYRYPEFPEEIMHDLSDTLSWSK